MASLLPFMVTLGEPMATLMVLAAPMRLRRVFSQSARASLPGVLKSFA